MGKSTIQLTTYQLNKMWNQFNLELPFQRNYVRGKDIQWQSLLIHTLMEDGYVQPILVWKNGDKIVDSNGKEKPVYHCVDGKQRLITVVARFILDKFALHPDTPDVENVKVAGLKFSELPMHLQQEILGFSFSITILDETFTLEEVEKIYYRINQTRPLSDIELSQVLLGDHNRGILIRLTNTPFFKRIKFTKDDLMGFVDRRTALQAYALLSGKNMSFSKRDMNQYIREIGKNKMDPAIIAEMNDSVIYVEDATNNWDSKMDKAALKKSVIPSLFVAIRRAKQLSMPPAEFGAWAKKMLIDEYSIDSEFGETLSRKTSNREVIQRRTQLMLESLEAFHSKAS